MRDAENARLMTVIEGLRIDAIELAHGLGEAALRRFYQKMEARNDAGPHRQKLLSVFIIQ